jgi:hypothetical protein
VQYQDDAGEYGEAMPCTDAKGNIALPDQPKGRATPKPRVSKRRVFDGKGIDPAYIAAPVAVTPIGEPETVATLSDECEPIAPKYKRGTVSRANLAIQMLSGIKPGLGRRAFDNCFEMGDGKEVDAVITGILKSDEAIARMVYYGKRSYRACYSGDYPETHYASSFMSPQWLAIIILHGIITLDCVNDTYGMRSKVAALLPQDAKEPQDETATLSDELADYEAGRAAKSNGLPCELPQSIVDPDSTAASDWIKGWRDASIGENEAAETPQDETATQAADEPEIAPQDEKTALLMKLTHKLTPLRH